MSLSNVCMGVSETLEVSALLKSPVSDTFHLVFLFTAKLIFFQDVKNAINATKKRFHSFYSPEVETNSYQPWLLIFTTEPVYSSESTQVLLGCLRHRASNWQPPNSPVTQGRLG